MNNTEQKRSDLIMITREELQELAKEASREGSKVALKKFEQLLRDEKEQSKDKRLRNTEKLLRNYHLFKIAADNAVYDVESMEEEESANEILYAMLNKDRPDVTVESIKKSAIKTTIILKHIDSMLQMYQIYAERTNDPVQMRRYEVIYDRYIAEKTLSPKEIAEKQHISKTQVYGDIEYAKEKIAALIFGISSME